MGIEIGLTFFLFAVPAVLIAGVSKGGFGSGASFVAGPIMALVMPPDVALGILLPILMLIDAVTLRPYWRQWDWKEARLLLLGALPGLALGAAFWSVANPDALRLFVGAISVGYVVWEIAGRARLARAAGPATPRLGVLAGCLAGFTSFVSHAGGPVTAVYLLSKGMTKTGYQATTVLFFTMVNIAKAGAYVGFGTINAATLQAGLYLAPAAVFGAWIGVVAHRAIPERAFFLVTYVLLFLAGSKLIFDALT